jgi:cytochrome c biogenesis protein CcmG, thiol:disulfide interchange protein DsbE
VLRQARSWGAAPSLAVAALLAVALAGIAGSARASEALDLASLRGKVVYLDFWASWCKPCRESFPWMNDVHAAYAGKDVVVVAVNVDQERALADAFLKAYPAEFQVVYDPDGRLAEQYRVVGMPSSFLIDRTGTVRFRHVGFRAADRDQLDGELHKLIAEH